MDDKKGMNLVDMETGLIFENVEHVVTTDQVEADKKKDEFLSRKRRMSEENRDFVDEYGNFIFKVDSKQTAKLDKKIKNSDISKIVYCATFLDYDNILHFDDGKPISKSDLKELIGISKNLFYKWYNSMVSKKIIIENGDRLMMSKNYCIKGRLAKSKKYNRIFINAIRKIYMDNKGKNSNSIGNIIKMIPYVNHKHNVLCWNPNEEDREKINPITLYEILEIFGEYKNNANKFKNQLYKHRIHGKVPNEPIIAFMNDSSYATREILVFNPFLTFSGKNEDLSIMHDYFVIIANLTNIKNEPQNQLNTSNTNGLTPRKKVGQISEKSGTP